MSEIGKALHAFQKDAPPIHLDATNPHFHSRFASLANVVSVIRPILNKHGLVYAQFPTNIDGAPALETMLIHAESGEDIAAVAPLVLAKNDPQGYGSALTYARRYALLSILGLVGDEDDDANAAQPVRARQNNGTPDPHGLQVSRADNVPVDQVIVHFGRNSGKRLSELTAKQIEWYAQTWEPNPEYANETDRKLKAAAVSLHLGVPADAQPVGDDLAEIPF